jgi:outer membrane protein W
MKKLILSAALLAGFTFGANAQNTTSSEGGIKPTSGEITMEANVNLFGGDISLSNSLNQIRGRYFFSDNMAFRLGTNIRYQSNNPTLDVETSTFEFSLAPGIEKHFAGTNRLSPYIGADLLFGLKTSHYEDKDPGGSLKNFEIDGSWLDGNERGNFLIGLAGVAGCDFYVAKHLYFGYELGLELSSVKYSEVETTTTFSSGSVETEKFDSNSNFNFGPRVRNGIRVGFVF